MIGTMLGDYRIERELGRGGMGTVYAAEDQNLGRKVAIKVISASMGNDPDLVERFRKEAKALARLQHASVVLVHSFFQHEGSWVLVMEMVEGEQLDLHLKNTGALPWTRAVELGVALLDGLHHAHIQGVVHRDVKTSNCLLTADGGVKLVDFGIALVEGEGRLTRRGHVVGTPHYIAPEQVSGRPADPRTDLYSLGVVLYEMVTGRVPFDADSEFELLRAHLETAPVSPRAQVPSVPDWLEAVILRAMAKDPADRFADAAAMAEALRQGLSTAIPATRLAAAAMPGPTTVLPSTPAGGMPVAGNPVAGAPAPPTTGTPAAGAPAASNGMGMVPKLTAALIALALVIVAAAFLWPENEEPEPPVQTQFLEEPPGENAAAMSAAPPPAPVHVGSPSQKSDGDQAPETTTDSSSSETTSNQTTSKSRDTRSTGRKTQPTTKSTPKPPAKAPTSAPPPPPPKKNPAERMDELGEIIELLPKRVDHFHEEYDDIRDEVERRLGERREDDLHDQVEDLEDAADDLRKLYRKRVARNQGGTSSDRNQVVQEARRFQSMTRDIQSAAREMQWGSRYYAWTSLQKDLNRLRGIL